ncbi:Eco57I restriction-modification methylase domain-containing protein, partial [Pseudomonas umsongensis]|uniref:Eco57I restriction-modification methylase domain-containing protein n=1 Tax=Pseudomonas umsongensis TaxID=198618 RepID=UPI00200A9D7C
MHSHKTHQAVVRLDRRHIPKSACKVLEPAVGEGALLEALYPSQLHKELTLVDIDHRRLDAIKAIYPDLSLINADFVYWSEYRNVPSFDLIITNPPFSGRAENWIRFGGQKAPIEYAFFRRCVELLENKGTLVAIVPDTLINSSRLSNERS